MYWFLSVVCLSAGPLTIANAIDVVTRPSNLILFDIFLGKAHGGRSHLAGNIQRFLFLSFMFDAVELHHDETRQAFPHLLCVPFFPPLSPDDESFRAGQHRHTTTSGNSVTWGRGPTSSHGVGKGERQSGFFLDGWRGRGGNKCSQERSLRHRINQPPRNKTYVFVFNISWSPNDAVTFRSIRFVRKPIFEKVASQRQTSSLLSVSQRHTNEAENRLQCHRHPISRSSQSVRRVSVR